MRLVAHLRTCVFSAAMLTAAAGFATADQIVIYGTGFSSSGLVAPMSPDPNWVVGPGPNPDPAVTGTGPAYVVDHPATSNATTVPCCWVANTATSQWINPTGHSQDNFGGFDYSYTTSFTLPGAPTAYTELTGMFAVDDTLGILLNGTTELGPGNGHYYTWTPFSITSGFVAGTNTLTFIVSNGSGGPSGLQVQVSGVYSPEPASIALVGIALLGAGIFFRRRLAA